MKNDINLNQIDELGAILAEIAILEGRAKKIKDAIKDEANKTGQRNWEGQVYEALYIESNVSTVDWKAVAKQLAIPASVIAENTKTSARFTLKVEAK
jgi:hypothetical protein